MTARRFSLVIVTSASDWRGSGISFAKIARGLADRGHRTHVVTPSSKVAAGLVAEGVGVTKVELPHTGVREVSRLLRVLARHNADAVLADRPRDLRLSVLAGWLSHRLVVYRYNVNHHRPRKDVSDQLFARGVAATVYLSGFIEHAAKAEGALVGGKSYRIPNGFDTRIFSPDPREGDAFRARFGLDSHEALVMTAGKMVPGKRHDRGIQALSLIRLSRPLTYVLCGEGPEVSNLRDMAIRLGLRVLFTGMIDQKTLRGAYNTADLCLHTSKETFGNVVGEAMSCGRTVVSVREGAAPEVIGDDGQTGILVHPEDSYALASTITRLLNDPDRCQTIGIAARRRIEQLFPIHRMISGYEDLLTDMVIGQ